MNRKYKDENGKVYRMKWIGMNGDGFYVVQRRRYPLIWETRCSIVNKDDKLKPIGNHRSAIRYVNYDTALLEIKKWIEEPSLPSMIFCYL